jgi:hypothetical protein
MFGAAAAPDREGGSSFQFVLDAGAEARDNQALLAGLA